MVIKKIIGSLGIFLGVLAIAVGVVGVGEVIEGIADGGTYGAMVLCFGLGGFAFAGGQRMLRSADQPETKALGPGAASDPESIVLALAAQGGGRVTIAEIAAKSSLTVDEATQTVAGLTKRGMAESIVTEGGVVVYQIRGLLSAAEKAGAIDILDA